MKNTTPLLLRPIQLSFLLLLIGAFSALSAQPLQGDYTINAGAATGGNNFASFGEFAAALTSEGIGGDVNTTVIPGSGPYEENVVFENVTGSGPDAVISVFGNGETLTALTDTDNRHLLRLSGMSYVTINNLNLERNAAATSGFYGIHVFSSGSNITISNCHVDMTGATSTLVGGYICSGSETSILEAGDFHDINIIDNSTNGGGYGASVYGEVDNLSTNVFIDGNDFQNFNSNGVYLRETDGVVVSNNYFDRNAGTVSSCNAIQLAQANNINGNIFENIIEHTQTNNGTMTFRGIYVFDGLGHTVYNNVIQNIQLESGDVSAIEVRTANSAPTVSFNTISIDHSSPSSGDLHGIEESLSNTGMILRNNNISIQQSTSGNAAGLVLGNLTNLSTGINSDYNNIYVPGGNVALQGVFSPSLFPSLDNWQSASQQDDNSVSIDPEFAATDLSIPTNATMNDLGITLAGIETDITGTIRSDPPDMGAYEFAGCELPADVPEIFGPTEVCAGDFGVTYSVNDQEGTDIYVWDTSADSEFFYGFISTGIVVNFGDSTTVISVTPHNACGFGNTTEITVNVNPLPLVELELPDTFCLGSPPLTLTGGIPEGGDYSGPGVSDGVFYLDESGPIVANITYTFTDSNGCANSTEDSIFVDLCTSVDEVNSDVNWSVFPNPFQNELQLVLQNSHSGPADIRIFDVNGKMVWQDAVSLTIGEQLFKLPVESLRAGTYVIMLTHDAFTVSREIVKMR